MSQLFTSGGQSIGVSASASVLLMNTQDWFPLGLTALILLLSEGLSTAFSKTTVQKHQFFSTQSSLWSNSHIHKWKTIALIIQTFVSKVMSLLFNMLSRLVILALDIAFFPRSKCLNFMAAVTIFSDFGSQENKICHCFHSSPFYLPWSGGTEGHNLSFFKCWVSSQLFHSPLLPSSRHS